MLYSKNIPKAEIARKFNVSLSTINRKIATWNNEGRVCRKKQKRWFKLSAEQIDQVKQLVESDPFLKRDEIVAALNLPVSVQTITRICKHLRLPCAISPRKFYVKPIDCALREYVARRRLHWTVDQWERIVFTDESGIDNSGNQQIKIRRPRGKRNILKYMYCSPNRTLRVNYFSFCDKFGVGDIWFYRRMNSPLYCQIVHELIEKLKERFGDDKFKIVHDNAKFAWSEETLEFLRDLDYEKYFLKIPPYPPDMNIIENLWALLKRKVRNHCFLYGQARNGREMFEDLVDHHWSTISSNVVENLYKSSKQNEKHS